MSLKEVPGGSRVERKKEETKQKIIGVAMNLFKEQGIDATTMEQVAREADIAKGTLYNYFPVKEAIIDEYIKRSFRQKNSDRILQLRKLPDTRARLIQVFGELIQGVQAQKEIFEKYIIYRMQIMVSFHQDESEKSGFYLVANEIIELGQKNSEMRDDLPVCVMVEFLEFAFIEAVKQFYICPEKFKVSEDIERYVDLCINGLKQGEDKKCQV